MSMTNEKSAAPQIPSPSGGLATEWAAIVRYVTFTRTWSRKIVRVPVPAKRLRAALGMTEDDYYRGLLETPLTQRSAKVKQWAMERGVTLDPSDLAPLGM